LGINSVRHGATCTYACVCWTEQGRREHEGERESTIILTIRNHLCQFHGLLVLPPVDLCVCLVCRWIGVV
jgi:hypothetical protein